MRILIIKLGALGDVINTFPLAVALKKKLAAEIHWLVAPLSYPLVTNHPAVDRAILFDRKKWAVSARDSVRQTRRCRYDITLDLQRILKSGLFAMAARSRRRIGFNKERCKEMTWLFPFERIPARNSQRHMLCQYMEFGTYLKIPGSDIAWDIPRFHSIRVDLPHRYVVLNIGATKLANQWRCDYFARLADAIKKEFNVSVVLTGGKEDNQNAKRIKHRANTPCVDLTGRTTIPELVEVMARADAVVSCDTGPMHLASALGTKLIALFGPSNPERTGPFYGKIIQKKWPCAPCNRQFCNNPACMEAIKPEDVLAMLT